MASFAAIWLWIIALPSAFLDREYPIWQAKLRLLDTCDLGSIVVVGDSRAAADIIPALLPGKATNLAIGGSQPVESYFAVKRALACPNPPSVFVLSHSIDHFFHPDTFWTRSARFGFLRFQDLQDVYQTSVRLHDFSTYGTEADGLPPTLRNWMHATRFPPLHFASLMKGRLFARYWDNERFFERALMDRGHYFWGTAATSDVVTKEAQIRAFRISPVVDHYFKASLALLHDRGIAAVFVMAPINSETGSAIDPAVRAEFASYLRAYAARYPNLRFIGEDLPAWPDRFFGDRLLHMNPAGAELFSRRLAACLDQSRAEQICDLNPQPEIRVGYQTE
ncbi:MAG: hypothetical protein JOZ58_03950 [Acetobacteraceae bacterium]|nr:hypothetical protein [Acetobacteraceae bacterium]